MFVHIKQPLHEVKVGEPDPLFAEKLLEQFGGATGELTAALTYFTQSFHQDDAGIRDMLLDIATEELGHLEMVGMLIEQHTKKASKDLQDTRLCQHALQPSAAWVRTCWTARARTGTAAMSTRAAAPFATCAPTSPPRRARCRPTRRC